MDFGQLSNSHNLNDEASSWLYASEFNKSNNVTTTLQEPAPFEGNKIIVHKNSLSQAKC